MDAYRKRRIVVVAVSLLILSFTIVLNTPDLAKTISSSKPSKIQSVSTLAIDSLKNLIIKERASKTDYSREKFGTDWNSIGNCDTRNIILNRDLLNAVVDDKCDVTSGVLNDPYTGKNINFIRGADTSGDVQIDHVVALSNAWQTGAEQFTTQRRLTLANDPLELLAVDGNTNMQKSDGDAATWLPPNKLFRCQYVARQIAVKQKYNLWVTKPEHDAMIAVLNKCPNQLLPSP